MDHAYEQGLIELRERQSRLEDEVELIAEGLGTVQGQLSALATAASTNQVQLSELAKVTEKNQEQLGALVRETRDLIQLYRDAKGAARLGAKIQAFLIWMAKWPVVGAGLYAIGSAVVGYLKAKGVDL